MTSHVADAEWRAKLDERLDELYVLKDETFGVAPHQKAADIATLGAHVLAELDAACGGSDTSDFGNRHRRAAWMQYARGKTLNALTETHSSEAEQLLTAAVKLDPANVDAWIVLGECALKRQDIAAAESCFAEALVFAEGHDANALRHLSMVFRLRQGERSERGASVQASMQHAQRAVDLDTNDGRSWYVLGNAYLALFFFHASAPDHLHRALEAYAKAETAARHAYHQHPDLFFNRGTALRALERYAAASMDFSRAAQLDASLGVEVQCDEMRKFVVRAADAIANKKPPRRVAQLLLDFQQRQQSPPPSLLANVGVSAATMGPVAKALNREFCDAPPLTVCVLSKIDRDRDSEIPSTWLVTDQSGQLAALSIYQLSKTGGDRIRPGATLTLAAPHRVVCASWSEEISYPCLQVYDPASVSLDGETIV